ncbi:MAG TPA: NAD-dependent epimerase/dehydratase family protein [Abditibacteriaceae bacterium]|jgi:nucleoside-diphosphate-sugar epimerase
MHYVISGTTSGTGDRVIQRLRDKVGVENITCLVRASSDTKLLKSLGMKIHVGDVTEPESIQSVLNTDTIYIDMTHPKYYHKSLEAVVQAGVKRAYFITTTGIFSKYNRYSQIYVENEAKIRNSGITYTILRPSMIYGSMRDKNMHKLIGFLAKFPVFPLFGGGASMMQPVFVDDLADGIVAAIGDPRTENQEYNLAGPRAISYGEIVDTILKQLGRKTKKLNINTALAANIARVAQHIPLFPVTQEQVLRLQEDKVFDISKAQAELNYRPRDFAEGIKTEIAEMRAAGAIKA